MNAFFWAISMVLASCPDTPNCVCSCETGSHYIAPIHDASIDQLVQIIELMPRSQIIKLDENYLHAIFVSKFFHFVDDVEFYYDPAKDVIEVRACARSGYYDFGVNRKRIENIKKALQKQGHFVD